MSLLPLPPSLKPFLESYLPTTNSLCFVTLTYAQSLDSKIAAEPGVQTKISHAETKSMTHYLRSKHDAILVGIGTVLADDPKLNCRYPGLKSPKPVILDPHGKFVFKGSTLESICREGLGLEPYILVDDSIDIDINDPKYIKLPLLKNRDDNWSIILEALSQRGIKSVMVEGGAVIINELLRSNHVDSVVITVGPVFLGNRGVTVSPSGNLTLKDVSWWTGIQDAVIAGRIAK